MPNPRQVFHGTTSLITRRCTQRQFLLIPTPIANNILRFCMIRAAMINNISIHAYFFASNHYHLVLTDPDKNLAKFEASLNMFSAKCLNSEYGRWENLWATGSYSAVRLREEAEEAELEDMGFNVDDEEVTASEDILDKIVYTLTNPVEAGLVDRGYKWPGEWSPPSLMSSGYIKAKRPDFFVTDGPIPEKVQMELSLPPGFSNMKPKEFSNLIAELVKKKEEEIKKKFKNNNRKFMGVKKVLSQSHLTKPSNPEPRRNLNPRIACKDKWKRIEILQRLKEFLKDYRIAWKRFCAGERDVVFPAGTYKMREFYGVKCKSRTTVTPVPT